MHYSTLLESIDQKARACGRDKRTIQLLAVSKSYTNEEIMALYDKGCRDFGESRVEAILEKEKLFPSDCRWHLIGTLQRKKVPKIIGHTALIHSVDSFELAQKISEVSEKLKVKTAILLQVNTSSEETKKGHSPEEWNLLIKKTSELPNLQIKGLMTMAPLTEDKEVIRKTFRELKLCLERWKGELCFPEDFSELSMGMSKDYLIAIEEGATLLRIGSAIVTA